MPRKKQPKFKKDDLIKMIVEWSMDGVSQPEIKRNIIDLGYQISYFYTLYNEAKPIIQETLKDFSLQTIDATITEMKEMRYRAEQEGDSRLALDIQKEINKISGHHQQKIDITSKGDKINQIEIIKIIEVKNEEDEETKN